MPRIALVTCRPLPEPDVDETILLDACEAAGLTAEMCPWHDPAIPWETFDLIVLRSCWNYYEHAEAFRSWLQWIGQSVRLQNPVDVALGNIEKRYLLDLQAEGIPIVPTRFLEEPESLSAVLDETGWRDFVVKPTISAGSYLTARFTADELPAASRHLDRIRSTHRAMVQPFMPEVAKGGEVALIHIDGECTHGVVKHPRFDGDAESVSAAILPSEDQIAFARRVMAAVGEDCLYARVDLMRDADGTWRLSELELIEPSLFFRQHPPALARFVKAIKRRIERGQ